jgi:hypothetical protein
MTARLSSTQAQICRNIAAARKEGLSVVGIRPDGTVLVHSDPNAIALSELPPQNGTSSSDWEDFRA